MNNITKYLFILFFNLILLSACAMQPSTEITVIVVDENGEPVVGADVRSGHMVGDGSGPDVVIMGKTDSNGRYSFHVRPPGQRISASVTHEGYYASSSNFLFVDPYASGSPYLANVENIITLREIRDPVPMYARQLDMDLLVVGEPIGFDLFVHDWVAPHGKGTHVDLLFELGGSFRDRIDQDSTLRLVFPGQGNGMIAFDRTQYADSEFKSPYMAPADGYNNEWIFRKTRYPNPDRRAGQPSVIVEDSQDPNRAYMFRIRVEHDAEGRPVGGYYGKIMEDFDFAGAAQGGSYIRSGTLYLNPVSGERSLEMDVGKNLATDLNRRIRPRQLKP